MNKLLDAFSEYDGGTEKSPQILSGILGLPIGGNLTVQVPNRPGYVFVRIRDTQNEFVSAYNDEVSPVYNLPVLIQRQGNRWRVVDRDLERYENWGTNLPFLPKHGDQHSFNRSGGGGDVVWVYADQFVPLLAFPSGTSGGPNVLLDGYLLQRDNDFIQVGFTGSPNMVQYKPANDQATMGLLYLNRQSGNMGLLINSGTPFAANITGTAGVAPYIPYPTPDQEPLYAFRLVSGTQTIQWENLYNARQFYSGRVTGSAGGGISDAPSDGVLYGRKDATWSPVTGSGGGAIASGTYVPSILTPNRIVVTSPVGFVETDPQLYWDEDSNVMLVGAATVPVTGRDSVHVVGSGTGPTIAGWSGESGTSATAGMAFFGGFRGRGPLSSPSGIFKNMGLVRFIGRGHDGSAWSNTQAQMLLVADEDWNSSKHGAGLGFYATPTGTTTQREVAHLYGDGNLDLTQSGTYNVNGVPHHHGSIILYPSNALTNGVPASSTYFVCPFIDGAPIATERAMVVTRAGTVKNLYVRLVSAQPASGSLQIIIFKNSTTALVTLTIAAGSSAPATYSDTSSSGSVAAGDFLSFEIVNNATTTSGTLGFMAFEVVVDTDL